MSYFPKPSLNENDLAIIERGNTAAHSIEAGQYVSWHGKTGKAKAVILQGATLDSTLFDYDEDGVLNELVGYPDLSGSYLYKITSGEVGDLYTATEDCIMLGIMKTIPTNNGVSYLKVNNVIIAASISETDYGTSVPVYFPLKSGDVVSLSGTSIGTSGGISTDIRFYPIK